MVTTILYRKQIESEAFNLDTKGFKALPKDYSGFTLHFCGEESGPSYIGTAKLSLMMLKVAMLYTLSVKSRGKSSSIIISLISPIALTIMHSVSCQLYGVHV